jgi:hypothetical protein
MTEAVDHVPGAPFAARFSVDYQKRLDRLTTLLLVTDRYPPFSLK